MAPWTLGAPTDHSTKDHRLISTTLKSLRRSYSLLTNFSSTPGPLIPVRQNNDFLPGQSTSFLLPPMAHPSAQSWGFSFDNGTFLDWDRIHHGEERPLIPFWAYLQVHHFLTSNAHKKGFSRPMMSFECLCSSDMPKSYLISTIYFCFHSHVAAGSSSAGRVAPVKRGKGNLRLRLTTTGNPSLMFR